MDKKLETPTIEKIDFKLSDPTMCAALAVASGATTDNNGVVASPTDNQSNSATGR